MKLTWKQVGVDWHRSDGVRVICYNAAFARPYEVLYSDGYPYGHFYERNCRSHRKLTPLRWKYPEAAMKFADTVITTAKFERPSYKTRLHGH